MNTEQVTLTFNKDELYPLLDAIDEQLEAVYDPLLEDTRVKVSQAITDAGLFEPPVPEQPEREAWDADVVEAMRAALKAAGPPRQVYDRLADVLEKRDTLRERVAELKQRAEPPVTYDSLAYEADLAVERDAFRQRAEALAELIRKVHIELMSNEDWNGWCVGNRSWPDEASRAWTDITPEQADLIRDVCGEEEQL